MSNNPKFSNGGFDTLATEYQAAPVSAKFGGWWSNINQTIGLGLGVYGATQGPSGGGASGQCRAPSGCFQCKMDGQGDIAGCIDLLLGQLYPLLVGGANPNLGGNIPNDQVLQAYRNGLAALSNPAHLKQTDAYCIQAKAALQLAIDRYISANPNAGQTPTGSSGGATSGGVLTADSVISGVPNSYLLAGAVAIAGLFVYTRK